MHETCCPQYTISLDVTKFKPSKGQRHVLNRLHRYLNGDSSASKEATYRGKKATGVGATTKNSESGGGAGGGGGSKERGLSEEGKVDRRGGCSVGSERLAALGGRVEAAAVDALASGGAMSGLEVDAAWSSNLAAWAQVGVCMVVS